ncbi:MAG TPA: 2-phospho-L-lactate guanylyltransferase [Gammaproteobacteria bacterium]|nr:2-phospho-L-lactate guanylyltransferase [Gammaproteobacteria bacterium]|tara:strand:+ start:731 stop:1438 length:708 start_codon:yes stop_codon:yes gene_type:complete
MTITAVIPVKQLANAKQRLSSFLSASDRAALFSAMVRDVLTAVEACSLIDQIMVVTNDLEVSELGKEYDAKIRPEPQRPGLIESVTEAARDLSLAGVSTMVFLPGDVPLVSAEELESVLEGFGSSNEAEFLIVPAADLGGSNCVVCSPPDCITFGFGEDSFRRHLSIARELGLNPTVMKLPGIGLDIDTPNDLRELAALIEQEEQDYSDYNTVRFLMTSGLLEQLVADSKESTDG